MDSANSSNSTEEWLPPQYNNAADITYGTICLIFCFIGTFGNMMSFLYFYSKKRDISTMVYMMVTVTDAVISMLVLPVGLSFLMGRSPGILFHNQHTCAGWAFLWGVAIRLSIFFVLCLCITRTYSLLKPFAEQRKLHLILAVVAYVMVQIGQWVGLSMLGTYYQFSHEVACCSVFLSETANGADVFLLLEISNILTFVVPCFVVAISCIISTVMLTRQRGEEQQAKSEQQRSKNRATHTILMFALLYLACNVPLVFRFILATYSNFSGGNVFQDFFRFDKLFYFENAISMLLVTANSAVNPVLYFWRMPNVRKYTVRWIRKLLSMQPDPEDRSCYSNLRTTEMFTCETKGGRGTGNWDVNLTKLSTVDMSPRCDDRKLTTHC